MPSSSPEIYLSDFESLPWYRALLASPLITPHPTPTRNLPSPNPTHAYTFLGSTLFTPTGVRAMQSFHARADPAQSATTESSSIAPTASSSSAAAAAAAQSTEDGSDAPSDQWLVVASLGTGLNGFELVHGGLTMALLDGAMSVRANRAAKGKLFVTTRYEAEFKRKVEAPCVVLVRAWVDEGKMIGKGHGEREGNKGKDGQGGIKEDDQIILMRARLEDGMGKVYLEASARFVEWKPRRKGKGKL